MPALARQVPCQGCSSACSLALGLTRALAQMGHATAEAVVRAGLQLVPFSFTGTSEAVAVSNIGVSGIPVEVVGPDRRQDAMAGVKRDFPGMIVIDFTLPQAVNGARKVQPRAWW